MPTNETNQEQLSDVMRKVMRSDEQLMDIREDMSEIRVNVQHAMDVVSRLNEEYIPRTELEKQLSMRVELEEEQNRQLEEVRSRLDSMSDLVDGKLAQFANDRIIALERDVKRLNAKWNWLAGLGSAVTVGLAVLEIVLRASGL